MRSRRPLAVGAVLAAVASGCGATHHDPTPAAPPSTVGPALTVRVGLLVDPTSPASQAVEQGARLAISQYLGTATGIDVVVDTADAGGTGPGAAAAARRLVADHVVAVIGPSSSAEAGPADAVLAGAGVPSLSVTATAGALVGSDQDAFRMVADDAEQGQAAASVAVRGAATPRIAVLRGPGSDEGEVAEGVTTEVASVGGSVVDQQVVSGVDAAAAVAAAVVAAGADGVVIATRPAVASALVTALVAAGFAGTTVAATGMSAPSELLAAAGADAVGVEVISAADDTSGAASAGGPALVLRDAFQAAYGRTPPAWAAEGYDAAGFLLAGLGAGRDDPAGLASYLSDRSYDGVTGTVAFAPDGGPATPRVWVSVVRQDAAAVTVVQTGAVPLDGAGGGPTAPAG